MSFVTCFVEKRTRKKAFERLKQWGVTAYYVQEPSKRSWLHIHAMVICDSKKKRLKDKAKEAFTLAGLTYGRDFHVNVKPVNPTHNDYRRLCSYILKFNGRRASNRRVPSLFLKGLGLRKIGKIGTWFVKTKGELWEEYREEIRQKNKNNTLAITPIQEFQQFNQEEVSFMKNRKFYARRGDII